MRRASIALLLAHLATGCSLFQVPVDPGQLLRDMSESSGGQLLPVRRSDFPSGRPREGFRGAPGSQMVALAAQVNEGVARFLSVHGIPDGIAVEPPYADPIHLAYLQDRTLRTIRGGRRPAFGEIQWAVSSQPLTDAQLAIVDPERRLAAQAEALRGLVAQHARVQTLGRALLHAVPAEGPSGASYGFLLLNATPTTVRLWGGEPHEQEKIVAWVDPAGPQRDRLQIGDRVTAVNGVAPPAGDASGARWDGAARVSLRRAGQPLEVAIAAEPVPHAVRFSVIPNPQPNAAAMAGEVGVTSGFLELFPDDDVLAVALGHELAHITLGHVERRVTPGSVLKGIVGVGVLLPAEIAVPGAGQLLGAGIQGVENRFNRDQERDADRLGLHYARAAGYDPAAALRLIDTLEAKVPVGAVDQFLDIHPPYPERRALLEAELGR